MKFIDTTDNAIAVTLAKWVPLCNSQKEKRVRLDFEVPLTDEVLEVAPPTILAAADTLGVLANGITEATIDLSFDQWLDVFEKSDSKVAVIALGQCHLQNLQVFRPTPADGSPTTRYLTFSTTIKPDDKLLIPLVCWATKNNTETFYLRMQEIQPEFNMGAGEKID